MVSTSVLISNTLWTPQHVTAGGLIMVFRSRVDILHLTDLLMYHRMACTHGVRGSLISYTSQTLLDITAGHVLMVSGLELISCTSWTP